MNDESMRRLAFRGSVGIPAPPEGARSLRGIAPAGSVPHLPRLPLKPTPGQSWLRVGGACGCCFSSPKQRTVGPPILDASCRAPDVCSVPLLSALLGLTCDASAPATTTTTGP